MSSKSEIAVPKPLSAYVGLLVAALEDTREPGASIAARIARMPIATFGQLLTARARYDELAEQGEAIIDSVIAMVRERLGDENDGADEGSDWMADDFATSRGRASAAMAATTEVAGRIGDALNDAAGRAAGRAAGTVTSLTGRSANGTPPPAPPATPEPAAPSPSPLEKLEQFSVPPEIGAEAGALKDAGDLPLDDFDHMSAPQLRGRLRSLDRVQLVRLLDYERAHADRVPIVVMLENRLTKLIGDGD
jgi:hypothetical protein